MQLQEKNIKNLLKQKESEFNPTTFLLVTGGGEKETKMISQR